MSHVKLIARLYIRHKNMKSMGFFTAVSNVFAEKYNKKYSTGTEEWIEFETAIITSDYVLHNTSAFYKLMHLQTKQRHPENTKNTFIFL